MDIPSIGGSVEHVKLVGEPAASATEALQNMSQIVIDYLQHAVGVVIVDMHYGRMKEGFPKPMPLCLLPNDYLD
jgi:hypothetical protein